MSGDFCLLYSVHPSLEQARDSAAALLDANLVACCNILPGMESHYDWEGKRETATECVMLSKTTASQAAAATETIKNLHPYDCPAIVEIPIQGGNPAFLAWVETMVKTTR